MRKLKNAIREMVLHLVRVSPWFAALYIRYVLFAVKWALSRKPYTALEYLLGAVRRVPNLRKTERLQVLAQRIISESTCGQDGQFLPLEENKLLQAFFQSSAFVSAKDKFAHQPIADRRRLRYERKKEGNERQGNLILLKPFNRQTGEKGVLALKYTPTFAHFVATFDVPRILKSYRFVLEPSSYRNIEPALFLFNGQGQHHIFQAAVKDDETVLKKLPSPFHTIPIGTCDWIDGSTFSPLSESEEKQYDIAMIAAWMKLKRHETVFRGLAEWKKKRPAFRAVFIGYPYGMTLSEIKSLTIKFGIADNCDFFERIPPTQVAALLRASRMSIHFSLVEPTNKSSYQSWFCNVPLIVYKHNTGFRHNYINKKTGLAVDDNELAEAFEYIVTHTKQFAPREWIMQRSGYENATRLLNEALKKIALENGEPWTADIVPKKNDPNFLYAIEEDRLKMEPYYSDLEQYLR